MKNTKVLYALLTVAFIIAAYNQFALMGLSGTVVVQSKNTQQEADVPYNENELQNAVKAVIPTGVPDVYGDALSINYDEPVQALQILAGLDGDLYENGRIKFSDLTAEMQQRYVRMGMSISCEFCCGAATMVQPNGQPACGCAHSAAMRGLMKYLLENTGMTDDEILAEIIKVKSLSFPQQMVERYMQQNGQLQPAQSLGNLPQQVGGC